MIREIIPCSLLTVVQRRVETLVLNSWGGTVVMGQWREGVKGCGERSLWWEGPTGEDEGRGAKQL